MKDQYKTVMMYDSELKKNKGFTLSYKDFADQYEMQKYIDNMKRMQREKNAAHRQKLKSEKINSVLYPERKEVINEIKQHNTIASRIGIKVLDNINNFVLDEGTGNTWAIVGSSKRGKTTLMKKIYNKFYSDDKDLITTLFCGNKQLDIYKDKNIMLSDGFNTQSEKYIRLQKYINMKCRNEYKFLNMMDDILGTRYSKLVNDLIMTYRNSIISTIMLIQYPYLISKANRSNLNNIIIVGGNTLENRKDLLDIFLKDKFVNMGLKTAQEQMNFFDEVTANYGFFYIHNGVNPVFSIHRLKL